MKLPDDFYVLQDANFGLGNFINLTPAIRAMAEKFDRTIPVYFELDHVKQCFLDYEFIDILEERPFNNTPFGSFVIDKSNRLPDYIYFYLVASDMFDLSDNIPHTYIDQPDIDLGLKDYTLFMQGSGNEHGEYLNLKIPKLKFYEEYFDDSAIFTGSQTDYDRTDYFKWMPSYLGNIRQSLALIKNAKLIVTNDTGLAHAAGAMNKDMVILWKMTVLPKNCNPGEKTLIKMCF